VSRIRRLAVVTHGPTAHSQLTTILSRRRIPCASPCRRVRVSTMRSPEIFTRLDLTGRKSSCSRRFLSVASSDRCSLSVCDNGHADDHRSGCLSVLVRRRSSNSTACPRLSIAIARKCSFPRRYAARRDRFGSVRLHERRATRSIIASELCAVVSLVLFDRDRTRRHAADENLSDRIVSDSRETNASGRIPMRCVYE
jgi:hypothetical protein